MSFWSAVHFIICAVCTAFRKLHFRFDRKILKEPLIIKDFNIETTSKVLNVIGMLERRNCSCQKQEKQNFKKERGRVPCRMVPAFS